MARVPGDAGVDLVYLNLRRSLNVRSHHSTFMILFAEIMEQDVAQGHNASKLLAFADREMAETVTPHQEHAVLQALVRTYRERVFGHDFFHPRSSTVASFDHHTLHQVTLGKDADQHAIAKHRHRADIPIHHRLCHVERALVGIGSIGILCVNQIVNMHELTPGISLRSKPREYMPKRNGIKEAESCIRGRGLL